jgi:hypothetical protein
MESLVEEDTPLIKKDEELTGIRRKRFTDYKN